jgi:hypothetical protein
LFDSELRRGQPGPNAVAYGEPQPDSQTLEGIADRVTALSRACRFIDSAAVAIAYGYGDPDVTPSAIRNAIADAIANAYRKPQYANAYAEAVADLKSESEAKSVVHTDEDRYRYSEVSFLIRDPHAGAGAYIDADPRPDRLA